MVEENTEAQGTQPEDLEGETPHVELTEEEIAELKRKAEVSSQNFERAKKAEARAKELEELLKGQTLETPSDDVFTKVATLEAEVNSMKEEKSLNRVLETYPQLTDKLSEFQEYRIGFPNIEIAAKAFLTERDMLVEPKKRKGLEDQRGGQRTPHTASTMTADDAKRLRTSNFKEYMKLVRSDKVRLD